MMHIEGFVKGFFGAPHNLTRYPDHDRIRRDRLDTHCISADPAAAADFGASAVAPLSDVRLPRGWFLQDGSGGRMLPQPLVRGGNGDILLDELLGPGFSALLHGAAAVPVEVASHPLWRGLAPTLYEPDHCGNDLSLAGLLRSAEPAITLVRPDRFVLAQIPLTTGATATLDSLQAMLEH